MSIFVDSEVGKLEQLIIHSPDSGLEKVVPSKAQDWLFEDIVHLETMRRKEYDLYVQLLLHFLDPDAISQYNKELDPKRSFFKPNHPKYFNSSKVLDLEKLLLEVLNIQEVKHRLVAAIAAIEECSYIEMLEFLSYSNNELSKIILTGMNMKGEMFFPPLPNFIFTRDIGVVINNHLLLTKPAKSARTREVLIAKYIFFNHPCFEEIRENIIEIEEDETHFLLPEDQNQRLDTLEGGDVMMVAPNHLLIGISERTTLSAAKQAVEKLFSKKVVEKITLVKIPNKRDYMHIDTVFTQIKKNVWVLLKSLVPKEATDKNSLAWAELETHEKAENVSITQFINNGETKRFNNIEELFTSISKDDLKCEGEVQFVYSGNDKFPFGDREQWTDSCNLLVLQEGVAIAYDRNDKTEEAFIEKGFSTIKAEDLIQKFEKKQIVPSQLENTIILLPSAELSRARGGSHCMSLPLKRRKILEKIV